MGMATGKFLKPKQEKIHTPLSIIRLYKKHDPHLMVIIYIIHITVIVSLLLLLPCVSKKETHPITNRHDYDLTCQN